MRTAACVPVKTQSLVTALVRRTHPCLEMNVTQVSEMEMGEAITEGMETVMVDAQMETEIEMVVATTQGATLVESRKIATHHL